MPVTTCKNCEHTFEGKFCPNCSQKANTHRFTLLHFGHDLFHAVTHTDKGILFLIKELFFRPGKVAIEYNEGKRKKYFNPLTFYLIMSALNIFFAVKTDFYTHYFNASQQWVKKLESMSPDKNKVTGEDRLEKAKKKNEKILEYSKPISVIVIPLLALLTWLFFKKSGHNYSENLVFNIMVNGQLAFYFIPLVVIPFVLAPSSVLWVGNIYFLLRFMYQFVAFKQFYRQHWWVTLLKSIIIFVVFGISVDKITDLLISFL